MQIIGRTVSIDELKHNLFVEKNVRVLMVRLDQIHPVISGNKIFKLHYFLEKCLHKNNPQLVTFGGAYSNHLAATAFAAKLYNIKATGIVRGEEPKQYSPTLQFCSENNMQLKFISRADYTEVKFDNENYADAVIIPEGGYDAEGARGASLIMDKIASITATHIITALGTATTLAGLLLKNADEKIIGVPVLKNMNDVPDRLKFLDVPPDKQPELWNEYHFGGYAKCTNDLITFMNNFYADFSIPLDFVYTAKMMYGVMDKISNDYFEKGSTIACLHTGGLQGNSSIQKHLIF